MCLVTLQWRHNGHDGVSNQQSHDCLLNRLFRRRSKKTSRLRVTGLCVRNSPGTGEFPAQMANNAENVSIWWSHREHTCLASIIIRCYDMCRHSHAKCCGVTDTPSVKYTNDWFLWLRGLVNCWMLRPFWHILITILIQFGWHHKNINDNICK